MKGRVVMTADNFSAEATESLLAKGQIKKIWLRMESHPECGGVLLDNTFYFAPGRGMMV